MGQTDARSGVVSPPRTRTTAAPRLAASGGWDTRLYAGLRLPYVSADARTALANALGQVGVEAEYFLSLVREFPGTAPRVHATGETFLAHLEAAGQRLRRVAGELEIATQGYVAELEAADPSVRPTADVGEVWWPTFAGYALAGEPLELRMRACGFAYRHVVAAHLASTIEAVAEHLALVLHALTTLPPAGIVPASALYAGLSELTSMLQGYVIPNHLTDVNGHTPGLMSGIAQVRRLDAQDDTTIETDLAWAAAQRAFTLQTAASSPRSAFATSIAQPDSQHWAASATREWDDTIAALQRMRQNRNPHNR